MIDYSVSFSIKFFIIIINFFFPYRLDTEQNNKKVDDAIFNKIHHGSFGKASINSNFRFIFSLHIILFILLLFYKRFIKSKIKYIFFSVKSGSSDKENLDNLLKSIAKDPSSSMHVQESVNDANSIR